MTNHEDAMSLTEYIGVLGITAQVVRGADGPLPGTWPHDARIHCWTVTLRRPGHVMVTPWYAGYNMPDPPTAEIVLDTLLQEADLLEAARDYDDWCDELGWADVARRAETRDSYRRAQRQREQLMDFLGEHYENLLWNVS